MNDLTLLDGAVLLGIVLFAIAGLRKGLLRAGGSLMGFVIGVVLALAAAPWVAAKVSSAGLRAVAVVVTVVLILSLCSGLGGRLGGAVRGAVSWRPVRLLDALAGGALHTAMALLLVSLLVFGSNTLGISAVSRAVSSSPVLKTIQRSTPVGVQELFATLRSPSISSSLPQLNAPVLPGSVKAGSDPAARTEAVAAASASVVRVSGVAEQCSQTQYGSGFVVAENRVVTNAHVVAGVSDVVVEVPGSEAVSGKVVYYDAAKDLAVVATDGLRAQPLKVAAAAVTGESVAIVGYPLGGPLTVRAGAVQGLSSVSIQGQGATTPHALQVYSVSGTVQQGNSGGPLLNLRGEVVGTVFAKSTTQADVGFALTMDEVLPVIQAAGTFTQQVQDGVCGAG